MEGRGLPSPAQKAVGLTGVAAIAGLTFGASGRFQFLGWVIGSTVIVACDLPISRRDSIGGDRTFRGRYAVRRRWLAAR